MNNKDVTLLRDCPATIIPAGDEVTLPEGGPFTVAQALGGSVTLARRHWPLPHRKLDLDALGEEVKAAVEAESASASRTPTPPSTRNKSGKPARMLRPRDSR